MTRIKLSEKLIIYFMLLSMGAIGIVGVYSYLSARKALMARTYDQLATVRYLKKKDIESFYHDRISEVNSLAEDKNFLLESSSSKHSELSSFYSASLKSLQQHSYIRKIWLKMENNLHLLDLKTGKSIDLPDSNAKGSIPALLNEYLQSGRKIKISDLILDSNDNEWIQLIGQPIEKMKNAYIAVELSSKALDELMPDQNPLNGLGKSGEAYLVGADRLLRTNSRFIENAKLKVLIDTSTTRMAFSGKDGTWLMNDYRGVKVLGSFSLLQDPLPHWAVVAEIDMKEAMIPIFNIRNNVLFITVFIAMIVFVFTWFIALRITGPVIRLKNAAQELGSGKLGTQVEISTHDEIGELSQTFNTMSEQLKESSILLSKERARRMRAAFDGQDIERQRLSRELHDGLGQSLIAQKLKLEALHIPDDFDSKTELNDLKVCADQLVDEVRRISNALMPAQLNQFGLIAALRQHCEEVSKYGKIDVNFDATGNFDSLSRKSRTYLFRIVQEALTNILKHAGATVATVEIAQTKEHAFLSISDNGKGFEAELCLNGNGLNNMRERVSLLHGSMLVNSIPDKGTTIEIQIPSKG